MIPEIPILDCSKISGSYADLKKSDGFKEFTKQLGDGMSGIGFVYLINHGIQPKQVSAVN